MVLVTGSNSLLGKSLVRLLAERGEKIRCLDLEKPKILPGGVEFIAEISLEKKAIAHLLRDVEAVVHLLDVKSQKHGGRRFMKRINVKYTAGLLEGARAAGVKKFIFQSSYEVYGRTGDIPIDESSPPKPVTRYGRDKLRAEKHVLQFAAQEGSEAVIFRPVAIVGPGTRNPIALITLLMALGMEEANRIYVAGKGENRHQLLHPDDAATALMNAYSRGAPNGAIYNMGSDKVLSQIDEIHAVKEKAGLDFAVKHLSPSYAKFLSAFLKPFKIDYLTKGHVLYLLSDLVLDCTAAKRDLAWRPEYGNVDIILETIRWYREERL
jgi:nucleoside-diphosphate-sugar epimerase